MTDVVVVWLSKRLWRDVTRDLNAPIYLVSSKRRTILVNFKNLDDQRDVIALA